ncbi:MAG: Glycerol-3-phosphate transporter, ATP-binding protein UgpC [Myxococcaceae bacterium]|nr:Glycerol-3-phosphate transporter, ATP-binding protein UgpC [Myxococcaceae bacterium]
MNVRLCIFVALLSGCHASGRAASERVECDDDRCRSQANAYRFGPDAPPDLTSARLLLERACERGQGRTRSCTDLADYYHSGLGVPRDPVRTRAILERACEGDEYGACSFLGMIYTEGMDVPSAPGFQEIGLRYFERACRGGHAGGCLHLGLLLDAGRGTRRDPAAARRAFRRACDLGQSAACAELVGGR